MVEMALIAPLLLLLLFGIMESGWAFSHLLEVRHGAREGARLVATAGADPNFDTDIEVTAAVCTRMHFSGDVTATTVTITMPSGRAIGDTALVVVSSPYNSLTGFTSQFFGGLTLDSTVEVRLEQVPAAGLGTGAAVTCP
jgi:Flp pilus assembly protein TadG